MQRGLEILELDASRGDYVRARLALDGSLVTPFEFLKSDYAAFRRSEDLESFLARQAQTLLDQYGDARAQQQVVA